MLQILWIKIIHKIAGDKFLPFPDELKQRAIKWQKENPGRPLPLAKFNGRVVWLDRKQRRAFKGVWHDGAE